MFIIKKKSLYFYFFKIFLIYLILCIAQYRAKTLRLMCLGTLQGHTTTLNHDFNWLSFK